MIWESHFWKTDILKGVNLITRWQSRTATERQNVIIEKKVMINAYVIRKLIEARKLSDRVRDAEIAVKVYPSLGSRVTHDNWEKLDRHYNFLSPIWQQRKWKFLLDQIIHSFVFMLYGDDECSARGFLVSSDRKRKSEPYEVPFTDFCGYARTVGETTLGEVVEMSICKPEKRPSSLNNTKVT
jgi:hypothetical protein